MGRAVDLMYDAFVKVEPYGELMTDEDFIMGIFSPLYAELPELEEYLTYFLEGKESNVIGLCIWWDCTLAIDLAKNEVFYPKQMENQQMHDLCEFGKRGSNMSPVGSGRSKEGHLVLTFEM